MTDLSRRAAKGFETAAAAFVPAAPAQATAATEAVEAAAPPTEIALGVERDDLCHQRVVQHARPATQRSSAFACAVDPLAHRLPGFAHHAVGGERDAEHRLGELEHPARVAVVPRRSWVSTSVRATVGSEVTEAATLRRMEVTSPTGSGDDASVRGVRGTLKKNGVSRSSGSSERPRRSIRIPV